ncbi:hypothetical protein STRTUCAR8_08610 [Streptomyces turgidiscabies Car8]|uniref:Uncharacterized protein n=1 Tax=Streptomyces turgidiscabies (strain Car8) TaxID=698760 RepID=L7F9A2_STRT8|nr:hypothetical protein [Streptomyces turgidiscabies]ELP67694.1 hypothetical protein STRTUCAR8_08610 [Streptomyces turgidiscabies Car8]
MTRWYVGQPTKHGGVHPPRATINWAGEASSAMRRQQRRIDDKQILADYVQLAPGVLVVWERAPHRVVSVDERPDDLWGDKHEMRFADEVTLWERWKRGDKPERATWRERPFAIQLVPVADPKADPVHLIAPGGHSWDVLPEHYSVCVACGELPPCRHQEAEREADRIAARNEALMDIPAGHCLGCGEYVTHRQDAHRFPGPNLWRPDLPENSAVFHARQECAGEVERYRRQWEARGNTEPQPSLFADDDTPA